MICKYYRICLYYFIKILRLKEDIHSVALGFSVGLAINFIPTFGFGLIVTMIAVKLLRGNVLAGIIGSLLFACISPIFFYLNIVVGKIVLGLKSEKAIEGFELKKEVIEQSTTFLSGMFINAMVFGTIVYFIMFVFLKFFRKRTVSRIRKRKKEKKK